MTDSEKNYSQITFDFQHPNPNVEQREENPVNVGVRIKALKQAVEPSSESVTIPVLSKPKSTRGRKSLKTIEAEADLIHIPEDQILFQRQYYSIGEVADMFQVNTSLIRFWENEFDILQPRKNRKGDRHFRPVDIKNLLLIHDLLRRRKLTIEGAKDFLKKHKKVQERFELVESLRKIKGFLLEMKATL